MRLYRELERKNNKKDIIIFLLIGLLVGVIISNIIRERELDNMHWYEERIECLEQAPRYFNSWCDENNILIHN